jgi:putative ATP-binding cassette transporter
MSSRRVEINPDNDTQQTLLALNNVNVCIPTNPSCVLIRALSLSLKASSSLIITGPSGCGKSSLLRLLAGLQYNLTEDSAIYIPSRYAAIFIPQQIHLIEGTLREQLNYLRHAKNMPTCSNDAELKEMLFKFNLMHLVDRYSFDSTVQLWSRMLSLGEQQRLIVVVALATLVKSSNDIEMQSQPIKYFVLDETTAGCDELTEKIIYEYLQNSNVRYVSISHRNQLLKYHTHQLIIDPKAQSYELIPLFSN